MGKSLEDGPHSGDVLWETIQGHEKVRLLLLLLLLLLLSILGT